TLCGRYSCLIRCSFAPSPLGTPRIHNPGLEEKTISIPGPQSSYNHAAMPYLRITCAELTLEGRRVFAERPTAKINDLFLIAAPLLPGKSSGSGRPFISRLIERAKCLSAHALPMSAAGRTRRLSCPIGS